MELIHFLVAPLSVQAVRFSPPHAAPPLDRDDAMIRRGPTPPSPLCRCTLILFTAPSTTWSPHLASLLLRLASLFGGVATA